MYITITAQKLTTGYAQSVADFVAYLEKENEGVPKSEQEHFFNQNRDKVYKNEVVKSIDSNTYKLKQGEPKFHLLLSLVSASKATRLNNSRMRLRTRLP
ncbi:DUF5712 family protein [Arenibacter sp. GZD96]|uniref:DUF5712 family protein n=1 Tax=Aurantibrevibacter litoralis TaxID=3106030 RepID=UPI002B004A5D|nr:DUF5712 family protein [Arenibacter sp. GZD-96]MEA1785441.1 DUF5712 family protein [Arenibacter sp. GZD-96]